jgi:hypothetical protein
MRIATKVCAAIGAASVMTVAWYGIHSLKNSSTRSSVSGEAVSVEGAQYDEGASFVPPLSRAGWAVGMQYTHQVTYRFAFSPEKSEGNQAGALTVTGRLESTVVAANDSQVDLAVYLRSAHIESGANDKRLGSGSVEGFSKPLYVTVNQQGLVKQIRSSADHDSMAKNVVKDILATMQFVTPDHTARQWMQVESDPTGEANVRYQALSEFRYSKTKLDYLALQSASGMVPAAGAGPKIEHAYAMLTLDDNGRVSSVDSSTTSLMGDAQVGGRWRSENSLTVRLIKAQRSSSDALGVPTGLVSGSLCVDTDSFAAAHRTADQQLVDGANVAQIARELSELESAGDDRKVGRSLSKLGALFRLDPSSINEAVRTGMPATTLVSGLVAAGTPQAQKAAAALLADSKRPAPERVTMLEAIANIAKPTHEMASAVEETMKDSDADVRMTGSYVTGTTAFRLQNEDPDEATRLVKKLVVDLDNAQDSQEVMRLLGALGNTANILAFDAIAQRTKSADPEVRAMAIQAVRLMRDSKADELVASVILSDPDNSVRAAALDAVRFRPMGPLTATLSTVLQREKDVGLRQRVVGVLSNALSQSNDVEARVLLEWTSRNDPAIELRDEAKKILNRT